ncbi:MAG: NAD(P)H-dependent oxidoreductase [Lachnospira sp.]|nr:NAD(P)H-dependent oxidoreductase [Lachnospira sp.]
MKILVLNGSPRPNGNTAKMVDAFRQGAESVGSEVVVVEVCKKNISGCVACEYCHTKGGGQCIQRNLKKADMFLSSGASSQYDGAKYSFKNDFLGYLRLKNMGFVTCAGGVTQRTLDEVRSIGEKCM